MEDIDVWNFRQNGLCDVILGSEEKTSDLAAHLMRKKREKPHGGVQTPPSWARFNPAFDRSLKSVISKSIVKRKSVSVISISYKLHIIFFSVQRYLSFTKGRHRCELNSAWSFANLSYVLIIIHTFTVVSKSLETVGYNYMQVCMIKVYITAYFAYKSRNSMVKWGTFWQW